MNQNFKTVPNQKVVRKGKKSTCSKTNVYFILNKQAMFNASLNLESKAGFAIYMYFASQQDDYTFALSPAAIEEALGVKINAYKSAIQELIEKRYLIAESDSSNVYVFFDVPQDVAFSQYDTQNCENTTRSIPTIPHVALPHMEKDYKENTIENTTYITAAADAAVNNESLISNPKDDELEEITLDRVKALGASNYSIDSDIIQFSTGKRFRIIDK